MEQLLVHNITSSSVPMMGNWTMKTSSNYTIEDYKAQQRNTASFLSITVYSVFLFFGLIGNLVVFLTLLKSRYRKSSRVNKLILHLAIADLIVCCFTIPIEIGWRVTVTWDAGDYFCRLLQISRPFGLYLSSNTIICISLDRYFAIVQPLKLVDARRRGRVMLLFAWAFAVLSSIPQAVIFSETSWELGPDHPGVVIVDCVATGFFAEPFYEAAYSICSICIMYFMPLIVTILAYGRILLEISITRRLKATSQQNTDPANGSFLGQAVEKSTVDSMPANAGLGVRSCDRNGSFISTGRLRPSAIVPRQSDLSKIERARSRTLKLTILIVSVFIVCYTPYAIMTIWYQIDADSARSVDQTIQESLFFFAVSNSIINPYLYGIYSKNLRKEIGRSFLFIWRTVRDSFSKNVCGDSSFSGALVGRWIKRQNGTDMRNDKVPSPLNPQLQWTPPSTPLIACRLSAPNRALQVGPEQFSALKLALCEELTSKESYSVSFAVPPHHAAYLPQSLVSSRKSLVSEKSAAVLAAGTTIRSAALQGSAVAFNKSPHRNKPKQKFCEDLHSAASSFD